MNRVDKILTLINEKFVKGFKASWGGDYTEVYSNPTLDELEDAGEIIRFIAHLVKKKVYVFYAGSATHEDAVKGLKIKSSPDKDIWGTAERDGNNWIMTESDELDAAEAIEWIKALKEKDWSWAEQYIKGITSYLDKRLRGTFRRR